MRNMKAPYIGRELQGEIEIEEEIEKKQTKAYGDLYGIVIHIRYSSRNMSYGAINSILIIIFKMLFFELYQVIMKLMLLK